MFPHVKIGQKWAGAQDLRDLQELHRKNSLQSRDIQQIGQSCPVDVQFLPVRHRRKPGNMNKCTFKMLAQCRIENTYRPANKEHRNGPNQWNISDQGLENHAQLSIKLQREKHGRKQVFRLTTKRLQHAQIILHVPGLLSPQLCRSTFWFQHLSQHHRHSCKRRAVLDLKINV